MSCDLLSRSPCMQMPATFLSKSRFQSTAFRPRSRVASNISLWGSDRSHCSWAPNSLKFPLPLHQMSLSVSLTVSRVPRAQALFHQCKSFVSDIFCRYAKLQPIGNINRKVLVSQQAFGSQKRQKDDPTVPIMIECTLLVFLCLAVNVPSARRDRELLHLHSLLQAFLHNVSENSAKFAGTP